MVKGLAFEAERKARTQAETLRRLSQVINSNLETRTILETVLTHLSSLITYDAASIFLLGEDETPVIASIVGMNGPAEVKIQEITKEKLRDSNIIRKMTSSTHPVLISDVEEDPHWIKVPGAEKVRSYLGVPLISRGEVYGILNLDSFHHNHFSKSDVKLASDLAWHVSVAIDNAHLYENVQRQLDLLQHAQSQLVQSEKLVALGELVAGVAHELNNPLTSIIFYSQLLQKNMMNEQIQHDLESIVSESNRAASIVRNLRDFARQRPPERRPVQVNDVIKSSLKLFSYELRSSYITWQVDLAEDIPLTMADSNQLQQVVINLVNNARQAMHHAHKKGHLLIKTEYSLPRFLGLNKLQTPVIRIIFQDDGPGIPEEVLQRIFDPFFTTKPTGEGTGLGLSVCHGIISEHMGHIWAQNNPDQGASFIIELPVVNMEDHPIELSPVPSAQMQVQATTVRLLLLDDEKSVREVIARMLRRHGYHVDAMDDGHAGLAQLSKAHYDLIVSDIRMGSLSGIDFYRRVEEEYPEMKKRVLFITGDSVSPKTRHFLEETSTSFLSKPFEMPDLIETLEKILRRLNKSS